MAYDARLAERIRDLLDGTAGLEERRMFGGVAFLVKGHMACGIVKDDLMVRTGPEEYEKALQRPHARAMDFTGRPMKGFLYVSPEGCATMASLRGWVELGLRYANSLPPKKSQPGKRRTASSGGTQ